MRQVSELSEGTAVSSKTEWNVLLCQNREGLPDGWYLLETELILGPRDGNEIEDITGIRICGMDAPEGIAIDAACQFMDRRRESPHMDHEHLMSLCVKDAFRQR